jgi:hypothetical protein
MKTSNHDLAYRLCALAFVFEGLSLSSASAERQRNQAGANQSLLPSWLLKAFTSAPIPEPTVGPGRMRTWEKCWITIRTSGQAHAK